RDAGAGQRRDLEHTGAASAVVCGRCANERLLAGVDSRARAGTEHHRDQLRRLDGIRLHDCARGGARCPPADARARRSLRGVAGEDPQAVPEGPPSKGRHAGEGRDEAAMNTTAQGPSVTLVGGGIAALAAAVYLVRDGYVAGSRVRILEEEALGGSLDASGSADEGFSMRGTRMYGAAVVRGRCGSGSRPGMRPSVVRASSGAMSGARSGSPLP